MLNSLSQDLRFALRTMFRHWPTSLVIVLSLTLALGGNGAVFGIINAFLFSQLPYRDADQILFLWYQQRGEQQSQFSLSEAELKEHRERSSQLSDLVAFSSRIFNLRGTEETEQIFGAAVTTDAFEFLGSGPLLGRLFVEEESRPGNDRTVILDYRFWVNRFGAREEALGQTLDFNGERYTIVGVMPEDFQMLLPGIQVFVPLVLDREDLPRQFRETLAMARLAQGATLERALEEAQGIGRDLEARFPNTNRDTEAHLDFIKNRFPDPRNYAIMGLLQGALIFVLLIACANIANMLLARGLSRRQEIAMRATLGASRFRILRQLLSESLLLALSGGILGIGIAAFAIRAVATAFGNLLPRVFQPTLDWKVFLFMFLISGVAGLLFGLIPALQTLKVDLVEVLKEAGRGVRSQNRYLSRALVVAEITLATVLLGGAAVMIASLQEFRSIDPKIGADRVLTATLSIGPERFDSGRETEAYRSSLLDEVERNPLLESVAYSSGLPRSPFYATSTYSPGIQPPAEQTQLPTAIWVAISDSYLKTFNLSLLAGRNFDGRDRDAGEAVILVSETLANSQWQGAAGVGESLYVLGKPRRVVGIVEEMTHEFLLDESGPRPVIYLPVSQSGLTAIQILARARGDVQSAKDSFRQAITGFDSGVSVGQVQTLEEFIQQFFVGVNFMTIALGAFGIIALLLAAVGIFSVLSFVVSQRVQEIGIRIALGANRRRVLALFLKQAVVLLVIGFLLGVPGALAVSKAITSALTGIVPARPGVMALMALVFIPVTLLAAYLPARRAARLDPVDSLRKV